MGLKNKTQPEFTQEELEVIHRIRSQSRHSDGQVPGLSTEELERISKCLYKDLMEASSNGSDVACIICLEPFLPQHEIACLPCEHIYHFSCTCKWLEFKRICPLCKREAI